MTPGQVYREGAQKGVGMGLYLSALFLAMVWSEHSALLSVVGVVMALLVPFFAYRLMANVHKKYLRTTDFASLWMLGIAVFMGGALICALVSFVYLQYADPGFMYRQLETALKTYSEMPGFKDSEVVGLMRKAYEGNLLPSPIEFSIEMLWLTTFSGSMLSILLAVIIRTIMPPGK